MVALTHMRTHNDVELAARVPSIQLILGGWVGLLGAGEEGSEEGVGRRGRGG